jgi:hypothetical protein
MHSREMVLWAVCIWMTTLIASYFALERWRKSRLAPIESVADYVRFHRKRAIADQWMVRTGLAVSLPCGFTYSDECGGGQR